jgi:FixJ family two-component response regulator
MKEKTRWAFIIDKDEFVRLSLNKILKKYGFEAQEIEDFSQLEGRKKEIEGGMILADMEMEDLERWSSLLKKWNDRFILMTPLATEEIALRLKKVGVHRILKKPVEPKSLRKVIRDLSFPNGSGSHPLGKKREGSRLKQKGGKAPYPKGVD